MERDSLTNLDNRSPLPTTTIDGTAGKLLPGNGAGDRLKRDEWSEGAVSSLLEAYESKWILRNRAKLKGHDWEDVAHHVSSRENSSKSAKTQTQCKNKIESMKKRYRSESAIADSSSWPLFPRLDLLLRGTTGAPVSVQPATIPMAIPIIAPLVTLEPPPMEPPPPPPAAVEPALMSLPPGKGGLNSHSSIAIGIINRTPDPPEEDGVGTKISDHLSDKNMIETDSSTPALYSNKEKIKSRKMKLRSETKKIKRSIRRSYEVEIAESIKWLAETIMRAEQARLEMTRDIEKMRVEAEAKRAEMDLKRTEIVANTQVEIAKIFASASKGVDSSLRIGRI